MLKLELELNYESQPDWTFIKLLSSFSIQFQLQNLYRSSFHTPYATSTSLCSSQFELEEKKRRLRKQQKAPHIN